MQLRPLELNDASLMLKWKNVVEGLRTDFSFMTLADVESFIRNSWEDKNNIHLAIVSDEDVYMGTASLKHIEDVTIVVRAAASDYYDPEDYIRDYDEFKRCYLKG